MLSMATLLEASIAPVQALPIIELPAAALWIAQGFASPLAGGFSAIQIRPGLEDGKVTVLAASPQRMVQITATGSCSSPLALPAKAVKAALQRDRGAEHVVVVEGENALVSLRTYSASCSTATTMPLATDAAPIPSPSVMPGECQVGFNTALLHDLMRDLKALATVELQPFAHGLQVLGSGEGFAVWALLAGVQPQASE